MKDRKAYNRILKARTSLVVNHPFFASLALRLEVKEDFSCRTAWTDGKVFAYNPYYVNMLSPDKLEGLAAHTVMHPACNHHKRRKNRDHETWNRACDYAINWILLDAGITLPDGFLYLEDYRGKSADAVYEILQQAEADKADDENDEADQNTDKETSDEETMERGQSDNSGGSDTRKDSEESAPSGDPGKSGEVRDEPPESGGESDSGTETDWDEALVQAAVNARGMGKLPAGIELFINKRVNPKLCWREILSRFIEKSARSDYSWVTPNRRYIFQNLYFPSLKNSELCEIVIAVDTSGSIYPGEMDQFGAEISAILDNYPAKIHLIYCDAKIASHKIYDRCDLPIAINPKGGGGTDFRPVFNHVSKAAVTPACLIYLTDLECNYFPDHPPHYPVLWVKTGDSSNIPPFGELMELT